MANVSLGTALRQLLRRVGRGSTETLGDGDLLERFCRSRDEAAFAELVDRHGPMVLGVCRRLLQHTQDAEDVFQATFLVLARKAHSLDRTRPLGNWLYGVAYHLALKARRGAGRRRYHERQAPAMATSEQSADSQELHQVLDGELSRLPEKYRAPLVLCYLQGKTNEEAARELGWPPGSIARRLSRARDLLRDHLVGRGIVPAAAAGAGVGLRESASASLRDATVQAALLFTSHSATVAGVSGPAVALAEGMLQTMFLHKVKVGALILLTVVLLASGAGWLGHRLLAEAPPQAPPVVAVAVVPPPPERLPEIGWGQPRNGLRLHAETDRPFYRLGRDLVLVTFILHNTTEKVIPVTLGLTAEERTDLILTGPDGKERRVAGYRGERSATGVFSWYIRSGKVAQVPMAIDPAQKGAELPPGRYRLRGVFRYDGPATADWLKDKFTLESNEASFSLGDGKDDGAASVPAGATQEGYRLSLLGERPGWRAGDAPLSFVVAFDHVGPDQGKKIPAFLYNTVYVLEVTGPDGQKFIVPQPTGLPSLTSPVFHHANAPVGRRVGSCLLWDPAGKGGNPENKDDVRVACGPAAAAPGKYRVRAVLQQPVGEAAHSLNPSPQGPWSMAKMKVVPEKKDKGTAQLESNELEVWVGDGKTLPPPLTAKEVAARWGALQSPDPLVAGWAVWALAASPAQSLPWLKERVRPVARLEPQRLARLLADLDANDFAVRQKASQELEALAELAEPALKAELGRRPSLEKRQRIDQLLSRLAGPTAQQLQACRAVAVLDRIGTAEARQVLEALAKGDPGARLSRHARAVLDRQETHRP